MCREKNAKILKLWLSDLRTVPSVLPEKSPLESLLKYNFI